MARKSVKFINREILRYCQELKCLMKLKYSNYFGVRLEVKIQSLEINPNTLWKFRIY